MFSQPNPIAMPARPDAGQLVVIMPASELAPDRDRADTSRIWWILSSPEVSGDPVTQIGRIYWIEPGVIDSLPNGGYGAEFCTSWPTPRPLIGEIVPPKVKFDEVWCDVRDRLIAANAYPVHRLSERPATTPPLVF